MSRKRPVNYLNNKDILKEIHASKMTFCSALSDTFERFDHIVLSTDELNNDAIEIAKQNRAARLSSAAYEKGVNDWIATDGKPANKPKQAQFRVDPETISSSEIIVRVMTYDHIPEAPGRKKTPRTEADLHARLNFPPFKHYAFRDGEWQEVLRSHWEDGIHNGKFSTTHGTLTNELAKMMLKLVQRYAMRGNWRNYTFNDEMQSAALLQLSEVGLKFNEAKSQNPFAYYTATVNNSFTRVFNTEKRNQNIRDDVLQENGHMPSFNRQIDDLATQQRSREDSQEKANQELQARGFNIF